MMKLKKDHDIAIDPHQKELILMKWNMKAKVCKHNRQWN